MSSISSFIKQIKKEAKDCYLRPLNNAIGTAGIVGYDTATLHTPVDTGRLRSAWRLTKDRVSRSKPKEPLKPIGHIKGHDIFSSELANSQSSAKRVSNSFDVMKHTNLYLTNNVSYASIIDYQYSMMSIAKEAMMSVLSTSIRRI